MLSQSRGSPPLAEIHVSESSEIIAGLLSMISGQEIPNFHTLEFLQDVLYTAEKYEMVGPISIIRLAIVKPAFLDKYPVRVYGIACKMGWIEEAKLASTKTLAIDLLAHDAVKDLSAVESPHLAALFLLHRRRRDSLRGKLDSNVFSANERPATCFYCKKELAPPFDWMHLKYVWTTLAELQPGVLGSNVLFLRPELWDVLNASCQHCQKPLYNSQNTVSNIMLVLDSLPTEIEVRDYDSASSYALTAYGTQL